MNPETLCQSIPSPQWKKRLVLRRERESTTDESFSYASVIDEVLYAALRSSQVAHNA